MVHSLKENLQYIAKNKKLLILSGQELEQYQEVFDMFASYTIETITSLSLDRLKSHIIAHEYDILFIELDTNAQEIYYILTTLAQSCIEPVLLLSMGESYKHESPGLLNISKGIISNDFDKNTLMSKLFQAICQPYTKSYIESIHNSITKDKDLDKVNLDEFLDTYEGQVLFLSETLKSLVSQLDAGLLNASLIKTCSQNIQDIASIFAKHYYTKVVSPIFLELSEYLDELVLENIDITKLDGFIFLARIMQDINFYLIEYFVERKFSDVHLFQDSLQNSILFMIAKLQGEEDDTSELEFL